MRASHLSSIISNLSSFHCALSVALCALLCLLLAACSRSPRAELRMADDVMEADPDSAMAILAAIDRSTLADGELPLYALLFTQAQIKQNVRLTSDSLIALALDAYRFDAPDPSLRLRAHFYAAQVAYYRGDMPAAMRTAIVAYELSRRATDPYWTAKAAELIADIFDEVYNYPQSKKFRREAADNYNMAGKIRNHRFALCDLAINFINQGKPYQASEILDSLQQTVLSENPLDSVLSNYIIRHQISTALELFDYAAMDSLMAKYKHYPNFDADFYDSIFSGYIAANNGDSITAVSSLIDAYGMTDNLREQIQIMYADYCYSLSLENYRRAAMLADSLIQMQSDIAKDVIEQSVTNIQRDFYAELEAQQQRKARIRLYLIIGICTIALLAIIAIYNISRLRIKTAKAELTANLSELSRLQSLMEKQSGKLEVLFKEKWATLDKLGNEYLSLPESSNVQAIMLARIEKELEELRNPKNLETIEDAVNEYCGNVMTVIRSECDFIKQKDFLLLSLLIAGFSVRIISLITGINPENVYKKKYRICARIEKSSAPRKTFILSKLTQPAASSNAEK